MRARTAFRCGLAASLLAAAACRSVPRFPFEVRVAGNEAFGDATLLRSVERELGEFAEEHRAASIDDAAFAIELLYRSSGYPDAHVDYAVGPEEPGSDVEFRVDEGPRTEIRSIEFTGNHTFSEKELRGFFAGPRLGLLGRGPRLYVSQSVGDAISGIDAAYVSRGHLDASVGPADVRFDASRRHVDVVVSIDEGERYRLESAEVTYPAAEPLFEAECKRIASGFVGRVFSPRLPYEIRSELLQVFLERGYADVTIGIERELTPGVAHLRLAIEPGRAVTISEIVFRGKVDVTRSFLLARMELAEGDTYSASAVQKSVERLYATGNFRQISAQLEKSDATSRKLIVELEEPRSLEIFVEPGVGSYEGLRIRVGAREANLLGSGLRLDAQVKLAQKETSASTTLTDPWFLRKDRLSAELGLNYTDREEPSFTSVESKVTTSATYAWDADSTTTVGYQYGRSNAVDVAPDISEEDIPEDAIDISSVFVRQRYDVRDGVLVPTKGFLGEVGLEVGSKILGSELSFLRPRLSASYYVPIQADTVLATSLRAGWIAPIEGEAGIPIQERFFNGGENSVRSFRQSELGPKDADGDPLGGESFGTLNVELRQRLFGNLHGAAFFDAGTVSPDVEDTLDFEFYGTAIGAGLRYMLPVGPLRIDVGVNPDPGDGEDDYVVHFSVGMAF